MIGSWTDWDLTDLGKKQAHTIGRNLQKVLQNNSYSIYSSDLLRAKNTAIPISKSINAKSINYTHHLRERNLGSAVGKSVQWLKDNIKKHEEFTYDRCFDDAESREDAWNRLYPFYKQIIENNEENIIIVSHGDLLSLFFSMFLGREINDLNNFNLSGISGGVSFLEVDNNSNHFIRQLNDLSYLTTP